MGPHSPPVRATASLLGAALMLVPAPSCRRSPGAAGGAASVVQAAPDLANASRGPAHLAAGQSIADVAARVTPSVVNVFSEKRAQNGAELSPFFSDPFFRFFFDQPDRGWRQAPPRREQSLGSGVIVSPDGVVVTNNHVVAQADKIRVALKDGREFAAKLVGSDPKSDVAVLRVDATGLPAISLGDSSRIRIGDLVLAIGNPFGIGQTVTLGIVSAVGRANMGITDYEDFIQTDAAINPGNSGGALVTMDGQLIGINTAIVSRSGGYQGIGFAIPSNMVQDVKNSILQHGKVIRGWLGVSIQDLTEDLGKSMDIAARAGVLVSDVSADSPAAAAGLKRGDVITAIDGVKTTDSAHLRNQIARAGKGTKVRIDLVRDGATQTLTATLGEAPAELAPDGVTAAEGKELFAGVRLEELDARERARLRVPPTVRGVLVSHIDPGSPGEGTGLRPGDIIVEVDRKQTPSVEAFQKAANTTGSRALLLVFRDGFTIFLSVSKRAP